MTYLNPNPHALDAEEVIAGARMIAWISSEPEARAIVEAYTVRHIRKDFRRWPRLDGMSAAVCTMAFEALHQGRDTDKVLTLLTLEDPYDRMLQMGLASTFKERVRTVHAGVQRLNTDPVFKNARYNHARNTFVQA
jgi:hypothetical protein